MKELTNNEAYKLLTEAIKLKEELEEKIKCSVY